MFYICYDLNDNLVCFLNDIYELSLFIKSPIKEINRKFKNAKTNYILSDVNSKRYKFYRYS